MHLFIEPVEPLLFRTGRPFDAGQDSFAESLFPPTPETLQGAVRAAIAAYWDPHKNIAGAFDDPQLRQLIGDRDGYGRFRVAGLALGRYHKANPQTIERLFPPPAHIMRSDDDAKIHRLLPHPLDESIQSNFPDGMRYYLRPEQGQIDDLKPIEGWLTETDLRRVLGKGAITDITIVKRHDVYQEESRLGIGIQNSTKANQEGFLYQMVMIRMNHHLEHDYIYGFVVDIHLAPDSTSHDLVSYKEDIGQELHLPTEGWMTLGGEQRAAHFRIFSLPSQPARMRTYERSLLYLATPAAFDRGWKPSPRLAPLDALLTVALNRYESIGGWKLNPGDAKGENKVMRRCVPAGSVYFFDKRVNSPVLTEYGMEIGYGISYEGEW